MASSGILTISLDFELYWGVRDHRTLEQYGPNILGVREAIPKILELFQKYGIHATWATVGFLFFETKEALKAAIPTLLPDYQNKSLSPYLYLDQIGDSEHSDHYHYAKSLINKIRQTPNQEIATHTFSHFYCLEPGQSLQDFRADLAAAKKAAENLDIKIKSLVFPRNQFQPEYLSACGDAEITCYRGNQDSWLYEARNQETESRIRRAVRLLDAYTNLSGHHHYSLKNVQGPRQMPKNIPASRFLRPYSRRLKSFEPMRKRRILSDISSAAKHGEIYHLWWHPHNFGVNLHENLTFLTDILEHSACLRAEGRLESLNMGEIAKRHE